MRYWIDSRYKDTFYAIENRVLDFHLAIGCRRLPVQFLLLLAVCIERQLKWVETEFFFLA